MFKLKYIFLHTAEERDTFKTIRASSMPISGVIDMGVNNNK